MSLQQQPTSGTETVTVGNGQELPIIDIGSGELCTSSHNFMLDGILRVPDLASNLLFVHKLCLQNNAFCYFDAYRFSIQDLPMGKILYKGLCKDGVYPIPSPSSLHSSSTANTASSASSSSVATAVSPTTSAQILLWHNRLGHPSSKLLHSAIQSINSSFTFNNVDDCYSSCTFCISAKMHKLPLSKHEISSTSMLQIVHTDVWGLAPLTSLFGYNFYVFFIDDYTRFKWFFLLKQKSDLFTVFKHFKNLVENQYSTKIKVLRSDNGGEYLSSQFQSFCSNHGILHQTSCPHVPQQNGIFERKHRHLVETGLALLYKSHLPLNFWSYAFSTASFLINKLPSSVFGFKSPWELVNSMSPSISTLRTFGCACYPYLRPYNKHKLQPRSTECIFLGYPPLSKGYLCLDPTINGVYVTCYALFNENRFPFADNPHLTNSQTPFSMSHEVLIGFLLLLQVLLLLQIMSLIFLHLVLLLMMIFFP